MKELSRVICDLHYEALAELFNYLPNDFLQDANKDFESNKKDLPYHLTQISIYLRQASPHATKAWAISKPFMEQNNKQ